MPRELRVIHKFPLPLPFKQAFGLMFPEGTRVLHVAVEGREPCMWLDLKHTENDSYETMDFFLAKDDERLPPGKLAYLGSFKYRRVMWHLFKQLPDMEAVPEGVATPRKLYAERRLEPDFGVRRLGRQSACEHLGVALETAATTPRPPF